MTAEAANAAGKKTSAASSFTTAKASKQVFPAVSPLRGTTVGVGMPIRVYFDAPVADREAALARMKVTSSVPTQGAWRWFSDSEVHWRPKTYWKAGTQVALDTDLYGVKLGNGVYGGAEGRPAHRVHHRPLARQRRRRPHPPDEGLRRRQARPDAPGEHGQAGQGPHTKSGPHVVTDRNRTMVMDSTTYGLALDAGGYRTKVDYATRISNSGEFVHSAPWSVAQQGRANVSHGCINLSPANAAWFFGLVPVRRRGRGRRDAGQADSAKDTDVPDWTIPWDRWGE